MSDEADEAIRREVHEATRHEQRNALLTSLDRRIAAEIGRTLRNPEVIVSAFKHVGPAPRYGFSLAACCAMVQNESGGSMVWGHDPWNARVYPEGPALPFGLEGATVTRDNYQSYKARRNAGMQPQGCGITQLTSPSLQVEAERIGGCWVPFYNCVVGFHFLHDLFELHGGEWGGFYAYNGSGPAAVAYADQAVALAAEYQQRINHAAA